MSPHNGFIIHIRDNLCMYISHLLFILLMLSYIGLLLFKTTICDQKELNWCIWYLDASPLYTRPHPSVCLHVLSSILWFSSCMAHIKFRSYAHHPRVLALAPSLVRGCLDRSGLCPIHFMVCLVKWF